MNRKTLSLIIAALAVGVLTLFSPSTTYSQVDPCKAQTDYLAAKKEVNTQNAKQAGLVNQAKGLTTVKIADPSKPVPEATVRAWIKSLKESQSELRGMAIDPTFTKVTREAARKRADRTGLLIPQLETWLRERKKADDNLKMAGKDYNPMIARRSILNARATFDKEQARIARIRARLKGRPQDEAYKREVTVMLTQARETYLRLVTYLTDYECFDGVTSFKNDLNRRIGQIDKNLDALRASKTGGRKGGRGGDLSGAWVTQDKIRMSLKPAGDSRWEGVFDEDRYKYDITLVAVGRNQLRGTVVAKAYGVSEKWIGVFNNSQIVLRTPKGGIFAFKRK